MSNNIFNIKDILDISPNDTTYSSLGIEFNPFPRSGTSNINSSDDVNVKLFPTDDKITTELKQYIIASLSPNKLDESDKFLSATIVGDYGSGKTQLLLYVKSCLNQISSSLSSIRPYVIYVDNPGVSILEFIGSIISKISEETLRKYLWNKIIKAIKSDENLSNKLKDFIPTQGMLFNDGMSYDPFSDQNSSSYKKFIDTFIIQNHKTKKTDLNSTLKEIILGVLNTETCDTVVSYYFYDFISSDFGINKTWESITSGNLKQISGKEFAVIKYIIKLLKEEGFTDIFILVDEFEDITEGRLTKSQLDNFIYNLRTLLDKQREWCLLFALTPHALDKLKSISPPLADRISSRKMVLQNLNKDEAKTVIDNYFSLAGNNVTNPFDDEAIDYMIDVADGNIRRILKIIFSIVESAANQNTSIITKEFVVKNFPSL